MRSRAKEISELRVDMFRGYPEPSITWQREDKQEIVLREAGAPQRGNLVLGGVNIY